MITAADAKILTQKGIETNHLMVIEQMIKTKANLGYTSVKVPGFWITKEVKECLEINKFICERNYLQQSPYDDFDISW
jgi:hypothetical protein